MSEEVSQLKQLMMSDDSPRIPFDGKPLIEDESDPLAHTKLGQTINDVIASFAQLITYVTTRPPVPPVSTPDHAKEVAEMSVQKFRDSCTEATSEFNRIALQWEKENPDAKYVEELADLYDAVSRQNELLERTAEVIRNRTFEFFEHPK